MSVVGGGNDATTKLGLVDAADGNLRWTLVINLLLICVFEIGSGLCNTYQEFLGVRAMFGIVMGKLVMQSKDSALTVAGGIWGQAAAT